MEEKKELMSVDNIRNRVYTIRGQKVMLDSDLAEIYGYEVKRLNEQVKRNINRFPEDFMFQLIVEELDFVKSQFATSRKYNFFSGQDGGRRTLPYAFTEQGIYMLATVLRGELAEQQSIFIMRAFREMRHYLRENQQFLMQSELNFVSAKVTELFVDMSSLKDWKSRTTEEVKELRDGINLLSENFISEKDFKEFVIYKNQKFEADLAYIDIYQQAEKSIYVVDDYMSAKTLHLLSQKKKDVEVILFTENGHGRKGFLTESVIEDFHKQYPPLRMKPNPDSHDRWIVLDYGSDTEKVYHCGASSKDAGSKVCAISKLENNELVHPLIDKLLKV